MQFPTNTDEVSLSAFARIVVGQTREAVVIGAGLEGSVRLRDEAGRAIMFRGRSWAEIMEIGLEPSGLMVMEPPPTRRLATARPVVIHVNARPSGVLVVIPAQDNDPKAHISLTFTKTELRQIVARIAKHSGRTIRMDPKLDGKAKVTVHLQGLSWRRALRAVASSVNARVLDPHAGGPADKEGDEILLVPQR